jgi:hypothetical protein
MKQERGKMPREVLGHPPYVDLIPTFFSGSMSNVIIPIDPNY